MSYEDGNKLRVEPWRFAIGSANFVLDVVGDGDGIMVIMYSISES